MFIVPASRYARHAQDSRQLSRLLDDTLEQFFGSTEPAPTKPALDVSESERAYTVKLDVPGVSKEDIKVSVDGRRVTVRAQKLADKAAAVQAGKPLDDGSAPAGEQAAGDAAATAAVTATATATATAPTSDRIVYRERGVASYARTFTLPVDVEQTEAGAKLEHGVLTLTLPKRNVRVAAQVTVN